MQGDGNEAEMSEKDSVNVRIERVNDKMVQELEKTYLEHASAVQPPANNPKCLNRVIGPKRRRGRIKIMPRKLKIKHINEKPTRQGETTYRGHARATQPPEFPSKRCYWVYRPRCRRGRIKIEAIKVNQVQEVETTHQVRAAMRKRSKPSIQSP